MDVERQSESGELVSKKLPVLPQGAPTSPTLTNIICRRLDFYLKAAGKRFGATYSRYADDISFSGNRHIYQKEGEFIKEIRRIIQVQGFLVNESKVRLLRPWHRQEVTGLTVNMKPNVKREYVKEIRKWLYLWETYGRGKAEMLFKRDYVAAASSSATAVPPLDKVLEGKLRYMKMVVGEEQTTYSKLKERFDSLIHPNDLPVTPKGDDLDDQLESILNDLIEELVIDDLHKTFN
jgi:Reverse transcriptase (RNA-dependent DNA polymerase)